MNIKFSERFHQNLDEILAFIAKDSIEKAVKFRDELYEKISGAVFMPRRFRKNGFTANDDIRDLIFKGYVIVFEISDENIEILGIYKNNLWQKP